MKIKVASIVSTLEAGGPTTVLFNLIKNLDSRFAPILITLSPEPSNSRWTDFENLNVEMRCLKFNRLNWLLKGAKTIRSVISETAADIVHTHSLRPDIISSRHLSGRKRISTIHGNLEAAYVDTYGKHLGRRFAASQIRAIQTLEKKVACSQSVFKLYSAAIPGLTCIPNGVDSESFHPVSDEHRHRLREKLKIPPGKKIFLTAGALTDLKDPVTVIKGFLQSKATTDSILLILGRGPLEKTVLSLTDDTRVIYHGFSNNASEYFAASDYFISASKSEGLPNTVLEAMASGLPVCLSAIDPHKELLQDASAGFTFECLSAESLANAINKILDTDYAEISKNALAIINQRYTAKKMTEQYQNLYLELLFNQS